MKRFRNPRSNRYRRARSGAACTELALSLPIIVLVCFGAVEGAGMMFLKQTLVQSAYEGAKVAIKRDSDNSDVQTATESVLVGRSMNGATLGLSPSDIEDLPRGTLITVTVTAPSDANSVFPFGIFSGRNIQGRAVMVKE